MKGKSFLDTQQKVVMEGVLYDSLPMSLNIQPVQDTLSL